eukprot:TRINITY_DN636_c0_g1_i13.p1 TRINITY_DN636_c0_g1~~TRINITY_DN636_c0_g1_i13.p1  ORF type:complete len:449 (+),score=85.49 TRINITY_DN636_c0_g1_i13:143-1489(+)
MATIVRRPGSKTVFCQVCNSYCPDPVAYQGHEKTLKHKRKLQLLLSTGAQEVPPPIFEVVSPSEQLQLQSMGKAHLPQAALGAALPDPTKGEVMPVMLAPVALAAGVRVPQLHEDPHRPPSDKAVWCPLCQIWAPDLALFNDHIRGKEHKMNETAAGCILYLTLQRFGHVNIHGHRSAVMIGVPFAFAPLGEAARVHEPAALAPIARCCQAGLQGIQLRVRLSASGGEVYMLDTQRLWSIHTRTAVGGGLAEIRLAEVSPHRDVHLGQERHEVTGFSVENYVKAIQFEIDCAGEDTWLIKARNPEEDSLFEVDSDADPGTWLVKAGDVTVGSRRPSRQGNLMEKSRHDAPRGTTPATSRRATPALQRLPLRPLPQQSAARAREHRAGPAQGAARGAPQSARLSSYLAENVRLRGEVLALRKRLATAEGALAVRGNRGSGGGRGSAASC